MTNQPKLNATTTRLLGSIGAAALKIVGLCSAQACLVSPEEGISWHDRADAGVPGCCSHLTARPGPELEHCIVSFQHGRHRCDGLDASANVDGDAGAPPEASGGQGDATDDDHDVVDAADEGGDSGAFIDGGEMECSFCADECVDLRSDSSNCGSCGTACPEGQTCLEGSCECPYTGGAICNGVCVDANNDSANCGGCGNACPGGTSCREGQCQCPQPGALCGSSCAFIEVDNFNCGSCGNVCPNPSSCIGGQCTCPFGSTMCGTRCVDTRNDPSNCGSCGQTCADNEQCFAGRCNCEPDGACAPRPEHCGNGVRDEDESSIDCGGSCPRCADDATCNQASDCRADHCTMTHVCKARRITVNSCLNQPSGTPCVFDPSAPCIIGACRGEYPWQCAGVTSQGLMCDPNSRGVAPFPCSARCDPDIPNKCVPRPAGTACQDQMLRSGTCDGASVSCVVP
jgi:hypothetical protein